MDCVQGVGSQYRGFANTHSGGQTCANWVDTPVWHPQLALTGGLAGNYCRNPSNSGSGPHCYTPSGSRRWCDSYERCGGDDRSQIGFVETFEEMQDDGGDNAGMQTSWREYEGNKPHPTADTAFCGRQSMYVPNGFSHQRSLVRIDYDKPNNGYPTSLDHFPWMCMAYKIPSTSLTAMRFYYNGCSDRDSQGNCEKTQGHWRTIDLTNPPGTYTSYSNHWRTIGTWGIINDNEWHYTCINVKLMILTNDEAGSSLTELKVHNIDFFPNGSPRGTLATNEFWFDDFSFSPTARPLTKKAYPALGGRIAQVASVRAEEVTGGGHVYSVNLTYQDCGVGSAPLEIKVNTAGVGGPLSPVSTSTVVGEHSPIVEGKVAVSAGGLSAEWGPYATAEEVKAALMPMYGETKVRRVGKCNNGIGWYVTFTHATGDQPLLSATLEPVGSASAASGTIRVETVEDGGLIMGPVPVDYLHQVSDSSHVHLAVNTGAALCEGGKAACGFSYDAALTPETTSVSTSTAMTTNGTRYTLVVSGARLSSSGISAPPVVTIGAGSVPCNVDAGASSATSVTCTAAACLQAGMHNVTVLVPGRGLARGELAFVAAVHVQGASPATINANSPSEIQLTGSGFSPLPDRNNVTVGGQPCHVLNATCSVLFCLYTPAASSRRRQLLNSDLAVEVSVNSQPAINGGSILVGTDNAPTVDSVTPTKGTAGGGMTVTVAGTNLGASDAVATIGGAACAASSSSATQIVCTTSPWVVGAADVVVSSSEGISAGSVQYTYVLGVSSVSSLSFGLGGGVDATLGGEGFVSGTGTTAMATTTLMGREVYSIGHFTPTLIREVQDVSIMGTNTHEVMMLGIRANATSYEGDFSLTWYSGSTTSMTRGVNQYVLQLELNKLIPSGSNVLVTSQPMSNGWNWWRIEVRGLLGDVSLPTIVTSGSADGVSITTTTPGATPLGTFTLKSGVNATSEATLAADCSAAAFQAALAQIGYATVVTQMSPPAAGALRTWRVTFTEYAGMYPLLVTNTTLLTPGSSASALRITPGSSAPDGTWQMHMSGVSTSELALNATEDEVQAAAALLPGLHDVKAISIDGAPGPLGDRSYPKQWVVSFSREGVEGPSPQRCTDPRYVDWSPDACPHTAGDLFLSFHSYYWPASLPKPADLGSEERQQRLLRACVEEAVTLGLVPVSKDKCEALVPLETLAECGKGSGTSPPCWEERFSTASVRHRDGTTVSYTRDDSRTPSDFEKGYRFWVVTGLAERVAKQQLQANASVHLQGYDGLVLQALTGVESHVVSSTPSARLTYNTSSVSDSSLTAPTPNVASFARSFAKLISDDVVYRPVAEWRLGKMLNGALPSGAVRGGVSRVPGVLPQDEDGCAGMANASLLSLPYHPSCNPPSELTVEIWVRLSEVSYSSSLFAPLIRSIGSDAASGFALVISEAGKWQFLIANGDGTSASQGARSGMLVLSDAAWSVCTATSSVVVGEWTHIAGTYAGGVQRIFVNGVLETEATGVTRMSPNLDGPVLFGGGCEAATTQCGDTSHHCAARAECTAKCTSGCSVGGQDSVRVGGDFVGSLDEGLVYERALTPNTVKGHAQANAEVVRGSLGVSLEGAQSSCTASSCSVTFSAASTPSLVSVDPVSGWAGRAVTITGQQFVSGQTSVKVGGVGCATTSVSSTQVICTLGAVGALGATKISVTVTGKGNAANTLPFEVIAEVTSTSPTVGSTLGGATLTLSGQGFTQGGSLSVHVGVHECAVTSSSATQILCDLPMFSPIAAADQALPVTVRVGGARAQCTVAGGCTLTPTDGSTPSITSLSPSSVTSTNTLTLTGSSLPTGVSGFPKVMVGASTCSTTGSTTTTVSCTVGSGEGGIQEISVRFATGYAAVAAAAKTVTYSVAVTGASPSDGSEYGGRTVTVSGSGFSTAPAHIIASVGGRPAHILSSSNTQITLLTPPKSALPTGGVERSVTRATGSTSNLQACVGTLLGSTHNTSHVADGATIIAVPQGIVTGGEYKLGDGDSNTAWRSQKTHGIQSFVFDLGSATTVHAATIHWEGHGPKAWPPSKIGLASDCSSQAAAHNFTTMSGTAGVDAVVLDSAASGRYVVITLPLPMGGAGIGIRGISVQDVALDSNSQVVSVVVGGVYGAACGSGCSHTYLAAPVLSNVRVETNLSFAVAGVDSLHVTMTGLASSSCSNTVVEIGGTVCAQTSCTTDYLVCSVPAAVPAGRHRITVEVTGLGAVSGNVVLEVSSHITSVSPSVVGMGGGKDIVISGSGFPASPSVSVCGAECVVSSSSSTQVTCKKGPQGDRSGVPKRKTVDTSVASGGDDAYEYAWGGTAGVGGGIVVSSETLGFHQIRNRDSPWRGSEEKAYMRFTLDIPANATVTEARLHVRAEGTSCYEGSKLHLSVEDSDDAAPIDPHRQFGLSSRPKTSTTVEWVVGSKWKWAEEDQESDDIAELFNSVISRPGWRAGNHILIEMYQMKIPAQGWDPCRVLSADAGLDLAPRLRVTFDAPHNPGPMGPCVVSVASEEGGADPMCQSPSLFYGSITGSSEHVPVAPDVARDVYPKGDASDRPGLLWNDAVGLCSQHNARLCKKEEIFDGSVAPQTEGGKAEPFFGPVPPRDDEVWVPYWRPWGGRAMLEHSWVAVDDPKQGDITYRPGWGYYANEDRNVRRTQYVACCGDIGHPARLAADGNNHSFWRSKPGAGQESLLFDAGSMVKASRILVKWARDEHAVGFKVEASEDSSTWVTIAKEESGVGGDYEYMVGPEARGFRYVRLTMTERAPGKNAFGVSEIQMHGCPSYAGFALSAISNCSMPSSSSSASAHRQGPPMWMPHNAQNESCSPLVESSASLSPKVTSVVPARGTTAGGTDVTIHGIFFDSTLSSGVSVSFGGFACAVTNATSTAITCKTSASGVKNGGLKYVVVTVPGYGDSQPGGDAHGRDTFWYVDAWSARTTWGGSAPPTGCGSYVEDQLCTESVVIPEGQVILLDVSPPRFYLLLIEGTLIFDRKDLHLQVHYVLLRGGHLEIGTELEPFHHKAEITVFGHPKSIELPTFGSKVIACYRCSIDMHGAEQVAWTQLATTAAVGHSSINLVNPVAWPVGSRIVIATTDYESFMSSHSEVATVMSVSNGGKTVALGDISVCSNTSLAGLPTHCEHGRTGLKYPHLGETKVFDGRTVPFRAEVGLLSRNIIIRGDPDRVLCPEPKLGDDQRTELSCNQFGVQLFFHSPGHESLRVRMANVEVANGGQAFRLGRYAVHWHMIGNVRNSFQRNCSIHNSWNRGTAIHGTNHLRLQNNFIYTIMGHSFFIEDGTEEHNRVEGNLAIKSVPSMNLLNTDQTPACFWIVTMRNYILHNHAVASRRYGIWLRPEVSVTGTSVNTPMDVHPINIPVLQIQGNEVHSNGKYGMRVFDIYKPNAPSVIRDTFTWRNGKAGFTATVIGQVGFDGVIAAQNGDVVFESRATDVTSWDVAYIRNALMIDYTGLPLADSYAATSDSFTDFGKKGGPAKDGGLLMPWNENAKGGFSLANITFVNFKYACLRGCAHCGRGGSPFFGDGAFETRVSGMRFVNSSERALFRHPNEAFFYDMDGTLTGSGIKEDFTKGGSVKGSSMVGVSPLIPPGLCTPSSMSTLGTGGAVCTGLTFRRMWYHVRTPAIWVGKSLCVRAPWTTTMNHCHNLGPACNCLPYLKKAWKGNVWLVADGYRYNMQMDLLPHELADPIKWSQQVWDAHKGEKFMFTQRLLQFIMADAYGRPNHWTKLGSDQNWALNWDWNETACSSVGCGQIRPNLAYPHTDDDQKAVYTLGVGGPGKLPVPATTDPDRAWTFQRDADGNGGQHTYMVKGDDAHNSFDVEVEQCPRAGCNPPPPPPDTTLFEWTNPYVWVNLTDSTSNPHNRIEYTKKPDGTLVAKTLSTQEWNAAIPSEYDNVWIPSWRRVLLNVDTPVLGHLIIEGTLVINSTSDITLTATYIEIKGGTLIIAKTDSNATVIGDFEGMCTIKLLGTNPKLSAIHGGPRETPQITRGKQGVVQAPGMLGVFGTFIARGKRVAVPWALLDTTAAAGSTSLSLDRTVDWAVGSEIVVSPTGYNMHEAETRTVTATTITNGKTVLTLDSALQHGHHADAQDVQYGSRSLRMQAEVSLLTRNIRISGDGEGEKGVGGVTYDYHQWNAQQPALSPSGRVCGNGRCEYGETSATCPADCRGPAEEFGAAVAVSGYDEDYVLCTGGFGQQVCNGYSRSYRATFTMTDVEMKYYGQNNIRPGLAVASVDTGDVSIERVSFNRGYFYAVSIARSKGVSVRGCVMYRSHLPTLAIDSTATGTVIEDNVAVVGIFWNTHRGAYQGKGMSKAKRDSMPAMFANFGQGTRMVRNRAAGSERAGFGGPGVACGVRGMWEDNEAHSSLNGYWFDFYVTSGPCRELHGFTAWRMWEYGVYGELHRSNRISVSRFKGADNKVGVFILMGGASSLGHVRKEMDVNVTDALIVGSSAGNGASCTSGSWDKPGLHTCKFFMAWCGHLAGIGNTGVVISNFMGGGNMAPLIKPWNDAGSYPAIYGRTDIAHTTFADFGAGCSGKQQAAIRGNPAAADARHPTHTMGIEMVRVTEGSEVALHKPKAAWVNQADCIDMDCDGGRNSLVRDEDGTLLLGGSSTYSSVVSRGEFFNSNNFFGLEYGHPMNKPTDRAYWYPNLPVTMRTDRSGSPVNVSSSWLRRGYGIPHTGCNLVKDGMNGWKCLDTSISHRMLVVENMDADHEIRRVSPVAFSSQDGYTHLANGCMDHGWCFSYTCLKRLMTFWTVIRTGIEYAVHFTGTEPQGMRISLLHAPSTEGVIIKVYYTRSLRLQVFVKGRYIEDVNMKDGKRKAQLFKDGRWPANDGAGGYANQQIKLNCACQVGSTCHAVEGQSPHCETPSNMHGSSTFVKRTGMLHVMVRGHDIDSFVEIKAMPVVQISMGVSTSVDDFYLIKDTFISNLAGLLGIAPSRVTIVDVVPGNARREKDASRALMNSGSIVDFEIEPDATIAVGAAEVSALESDGTVTLTISRTVNILSPCSVQYVVTNSSATTAVPGTHFAPTSGTVTFASSEETKTVVVSLTNTAGYTADAVTFVLSLTSVVNATLGTPTTLVSIGNVHPPAPSLPTQSGASPDTVWVTWSEGLWSNRPSGDAGTLTGWEVQCKTGSSSSWDASTVHAASEMNVTRSGLAAYTLVTCRVRAVANTDKNGDWSAEGTMRSESVCGDSSRDGPEGCDDGGLADNDGCSALCVVEPGYSCSNSGGADTCTGGCGAGTKGSSEGCDDNNLVSGDGCDAACNVEPGYNCVGADGSLSVCSTVCGDSLKVGSEACDDGNTAGSDGCSSDCSAVESGWTCNEDASGKSVCSNCGNGILEGAEVCDSSSAACVSCTSVAAGYVCTGTVCVGGPTAPGAPSASGSTTTSLVWAWSAADGRGLALSSQVLEYRNTTSEQWTVVNIGATSTHTLSSLKHSTGYIARVKACTSAGCGDYSPESLVFQTSVPPQSETLSSIGAAVSEQAQSGGLGINVTTPVVVEEVATEPEAPTEESNSGALNQSQVEALLENVGENGIDEDALTKVLEAEATGVSTVVLISLSSTSYQVQNTGSSVVITMSLSRESGAAIAATDLASVSTVTWTVTDSTAVRGVDYTALPTGTITFEAGQLTQTLTIPVLDTGVYSGAARTFTIALSAPSGGAPYTLQVNPSLSSATVSISDSKGAITAQFAQAAVSGTSAITVPVSRTDTWKELSARVVFETYDGTAKAGADYVAQAAGTAVFAAGQTTGEATVSTVLLGGSGVAFGVRIVRVEVEAVAGSGVFGAPAVIGDQSTCTVNIVGACGNGMRTGSEECDDSNAIPLDGCSGDCTIEAGYECTGGSASAADTCTLPATPPAGKEVVKASAKLSGVSADTFNSDTSVRLAFVRGVADSLSVTTDAIAIESVSRRALPQSGPGRHGRRLLQDSVTVAFRVTVNSGAGADMAAKVSEVVQSGGMAEKLQAQGLDVQVELVSSPSVTDSSGVEKTLEEIQAEQAGGVSNDVIIAAAVGGVIAIFVIVVCFVFGLRMVKKGPPAQKALNASKIAPEEPNASPAGGDGPQDVGAPAAGAPGEEEPRNGGRRDSAEEAAAGVRSEATLPKNQRVRSSLGGAASMDTEILPESTPNRPAGAAGGSNNVMKAEIENAMVRDWLKLCDNFFETSGEGGRFLSLERFKSLITTSCVGVSNAHVAGAWDSLAVDSNNEVDFTEMLDKAAASELDREMLHFWTCLPHQGMYCDTPSVRGALTGVFSTDGVDKMLDGAGDRVSFGSFVEAARSYATSGGAKWGGGGMGRGPQETSPRKSGLPAMRGLDPTNAANEKSAVLHFKAAATRLEIAGPPAEIVSGRHGGA